MTPKEEVEQLLKKFGSRGTPFNDAGIFVSEMIYEIEKYNSDNKSEIWYWEKVKEELDKMCTIQDANKEIAILDGEIESHLNMDDKEITVPKKEITAPKKEITVPKVGDQVYVDTWLYVTHGEDDFIGGLCEVMSVEKNEKNIWITIKEEPNTKYNWSHLSEIQDKLKIEFGNSRGHNKPDYRNEFNRLD